MEGRALDPYEQQLLAVFESCDEDNTGSLDRKGLEQLCDQLQLEEQRLELMDCLLGNDKSLKRVTFSEFKDGLLTILREGQMKRDLGGRGSPEREVSPKFVFGQKKYGRRSKPENKELNVSNKVDLDDSDTEIFVTVDGSNKEIIMRSSSETSSADEAQHPKKRKTSTDDNKNFKRSISLPESRTTGGSDESAPASIGSSEEEVLRMTCESLGVGNGGFLDHKELILVCRRIGLDSVADEVVKQLFENLTVDSEGRISLQEFLQLFRNAGSWATTMGVGTTPSSVDKSVPHGLPMSRTTAAGVGSSDETGDVDKEFRFLALDTNNSGLVPVEAVLELWETAGMAPGTAARLARDLGLPDVGTGGSVRLGDLASTLESELPAAQADAAAHGYSALELLLHAALALYQAEVRCLRLSLEHLQGERDKLRSDILEANERASLLAQEVDDSHARLEQTSQMQVKMLEQRHAEQLREVVEQLGQEREQLAAHAQALECRLTTLYEEDTRLRAELSSIRVENEGIDKENQNLLEQLEETKKAKTELEKEMESVAALQQRLNELEASRDQMEPLLEQVEQLQAENTDLRDRNDELKMKIEALTVQLARLSKSPPPQSPKGSESSVEGTVEESGSGVIGGGVKRRGEITFTVPPDSPHLGKVRRCILSKGSQNVDTEDDTVNMEGLQIHPVTSNECLLEADVDLDEPESLEINTVAEFEDGELETDALNRFPNNRRIICKDKTEIERLQMRVAELEHRLAEQNKNLTEWEAERDFLQEKVNKYCDLRSQTLGNSKLVKGHLKQVFQTLRKQAIQELLEDEEFMSNVQKQYSRGFSRTFYQDGGHNVWKTVDSEHDIKPQPEQETSERCMETNSDSRDVEQLERHCRDLESQLDQVKVEIVKILSEKKACSQENTTLRSHLSDLQGGEGSGAGAGGEVAELRERCAELEASLELLRQEYERCEDYWAAKLEEERRLCEAEQRASDEKFADLLAKVREYEELCRNSGDEDANDGFTSSGFCGQQGRLPAIEERASLEKQVTDLEEECEDLRQRCEQELAERDQQLADLRERLSSLESSKDGGPMLDVAVQVSDLENGSWESDRTFVVELDGGRRASQKPKVPSRNGCTTSDSGSTSTESETCRLRDVKRSLETECHVLQQHRNAMLEAAVHPDTRLINALRERLRQQEQICHHLQQKLHHHQQRSDLILKQSWQQHKEEITDLQAILQKTQEKLLQQTSICKDQSGRLASTDILVKDLYVENAYLLQSVQRLEQRCHSLAHLATDSSSV